MFFGEYRHSVDDKGRIIMPSKYREQLGSTFYITIDLWGQEEEKCLCVYAECLHRAISSWPSGVFNPLRRIVRRIIRA